MTHASTRRTHSFLKYISRNASDREFIGTAIIERHRRGLSGPPGSSPTKYAERAGQLIEEEDVVPSHSETALPTFSAHLDARSEEEVAAVLEFTYTVLDKKYSLYEWTHNKLNTLVSINGLAVGGMLVLATSSHQSITGSAWVHWTVFVLAITAFSVSIALSLYNTLPKMDSGIGNKTFGNLRQVVSTEALSPRDYLDRVSALTRRDMIVQNVNQIKGMNSIVWKNQREIRTVTILSMIGLSLLVLWVFLVFLFGGN